MNSNIFGLEGKKVLITGATGGIGGAIADLFLSLGASCMLTGSNQSKLDALKSKYHAYEGKVFFTSCNLMDKNDCETLVEKATQALEGLDIFIANAGITKDGIFVRMSDEQWNDVIQTNLTANFILSRAAVKHMMRKKYGRIIYISSIVGLSGNSGQVNYSSSKAALVGMARSIALEYASKNITANLIAPGFIKTDMTNGLDEDLINKNIPLGKQGSPLDIANAAVFLASQMGNYITGEVLSVNGGMYMS